MQIHIQDSSKRLPCTRAITTSLITVREIGGIDAKAISLEPSMSIMTARVFLFVCSHANMFHMYFCTQNKQILCVSKVPQGDRELPSLPPFPHCHFPPERSAAATLASKPQTHCKLTPAGVARQKFIRCDRQTHIHLHVCVHIRVCVCTFLI